MMAMLLLSACAQSPVTSAPPQPSYYSPPGIWTTPRHRKAATPVPTPEERQVDAIQQNLKNLQEELSPPAGAR
jgi:hypothetical protein